MVQRKWIVLIGLRSRMYDTASAPPALAPTRSPFQTCAAPINVNAHPHNQNAPHQIITQQRHRPDCDADRVQTSLMDERGGLEKRREEQGQEWRPGGRCDDETNRGPQT
eukprot:3678228-Rhodomonas_salina.4